MKDDEVKYDEKKGVYVGPDDRRNFWIGIAFGALILLAALLAAH